MPLSNWARNVWFSTDRLHAPTSVDELQALVARTPRLRALGTGHSFNPIADTVGDLVSVACLPPRLDIDGTRSTATVGAGMRYGELAAKLHARGYALANLGSLPHISVGGACATGTHGSGDTNKNLAGAVRRLEVVTADGDIAVFDRDIDELFPGTVVSLGSIGVVTTMTLDVVPAFSIRQHVYRDMPADELLGHFDDVVGGAHSVSLFTDWRSRSINQVWLKQKVGEEHPLEPRWFGATLATAAQHPIAGMPVANCTEQLGVPGPWHERLPHFRLQFTPSSGDELQSEYLLPRKHAAEVIELLFGLTDLISPVLQMSEIRTIAADDLWLSPSYGRDTVGLHFTWVNDESAVLQAVSVVEDALAAFEPRPHWGKLFTMPPRSIPKLYPRWADFESLVNRYDPTGKFRNAFIDTYFAEVS